MKKTLPLIVAGCIGLTIGGSVATPAAPTTPLVRATTVSHHMRTPINWHKPSETVAYPNLATTKNLWIKVALKKCRVYIMSGKKVIYTMYCSGGVYQRNPKTHKMVSTTPTGTFHIQNVRGDSFFNNKLGEGANYYVSWKDNGVYLFHSVPTKANGQYNVKEAKKLGKHPGSHGCIRLSVADAKWFHTAVPTGTKVVITNK